MADDVGFVALRDLGRVVAGDNYRIIGGHMVMMLVARWALGPDLYRQTQDTDLGVPPTAVANPVIIDRLTALGYERRAGNRFARPMSDIPIWLIGAEAPKPEAVVDILVPSYTSRLRQNRRFGDHLVTTEVPGLASALQNPAIEMSLELHRLNGDLLDVEVSVADEVSALVLKAHATTVRSKATDVVDIWRCLEVCLAAGTEPAQFTGPERVAAVTRVRELFGSRSGPGMTGLIDEQRLTPRAADERYTRIRALVDRIVAWK
ncbi:MAG: hypothetical protein WCI22_16305 [Actinomycetota bacterium]